MGRPALPFRTSKVYRVWGDAKRRCRNPNHPVWDRYGGRGITFCDEWLSFDTFLADMGHPPPGLSLDRIDNSKGYEPGNCRWATPAEQCRNRRSNRRLKWKGKNLTVTEWAEEVGISRNVLFARLRSNWSVHDVLTRPVGSYVRKESD